ncbi:pro-resilin-like [Panulirus ornatus]|uniref:pro-resilin-like n=1 Tax=Panulirus ornatus TaxID=150431 RepID=UPI003A846057
MAYKQVVVLAALVGAVLASPAPLPALGYGHPQPVNTNPAYNFNYAVRDNFGNDFGHQESRDGYNTRGSYYAQLPDGRLQKVDYTVQGDSGFVAQVGYQGQAQYPTYHPAPSYHSPPTYG